VQTLFQSGDARLRFLINRYPGTKLIAYMELEVEGNDRHIMNSDEDLDYLISFLIQVRSYIRGES
jgi:hypothetical protein